MEWRPNNEGLQQITNLISESRSTVQGAQARVHEQLQTFHQIPDFNNYLVYILSRLRDQDQYIRTIAGLLLKNNIKDYFSKMAPEVQAYVKQEVLSCVGDPITGIRRTVSSIITTIITKGGIEDWPAIIPTLVHMLDSPDLHQVDGALSTIMLVCEDSAQRLDSERAGRPLNILVPKLLLMIRSPHEDFRRYSIASLNQFIVEMPAALLTHMNDFLGALFFLAQDPAPEVKRKVCQGLVTLLEVKQEFLHPHIREVVQFMLHTTQDANEHVALEACEFWSSIAETHICKPVLTEFLPQLVPVLLNGMVYSEMDRAMLEDEGEDDFRPDEAKDIKPRFHQSKLIGESMPGQSKEGDDDDDDYDDDGADDEEAAEWNLRKCSAAGLDSLSTVFQDELLPILLPLLTAKIADNNPWYVRESGILAIGAVAEGCFAGFRPHLQSVIGYLINLLRDQKPLIRSITCWTLSRYSKWIVQQDPKKYLEPLMSGLLERILDSNKKVQEAACSAFATLEEEAQLDLIPYLHPILQTLVKAFSKYQAKNLLILYDAIGTLAESVGFELNKPELVEVLMPPLIAKWNMLQDNDHNLFPLLECLTSIATALGPGFQTFAPPVYNRCVKLIENTIVALVAYRSSPHPEQLEMPNKEFIVCAIDLISGLADGMGAMIEPLVANSNLLPLLRECMKDRGPDVRQSSFALVGDLAKTCIGQLKPFLGDFIPILTASLTPEYISVCNNASWALGEIAIKVGDDMKPFVPEITNRLIMIMGKNLNRNLLENTAITLGRMGLVAPEIVAPRLEEFVQYWCLSLRNIRDDVEKESAFRGMCLMIQANPQGGVKHLIYICDAIASWFRPPDDLRDMFFRILHMYKTGMGEAWATYFKDFPQALRTVLQERYKL